MHPGSLRYLWLRRGIGLLVLLLFALNAHAQTPPWLTPPPPQTLKKAQAIQPEALAQAAASVILSETKILAPDGAAGDFFANAVSLDGNRALIGAWEDDDNGLNSGSAYIFDYDGASWNFTAKLKPLDGAAGDRFGLMVSLDGNRALIGAYQDDHAGGVDAGAAYVFDYNGTSWNQTAKLTAADGDIFGLSVWLDGNRALVGAFGNDDNGLNSGSAYVFEYNGTNWSQTKKLTANDAAASDQFGVSVCLEGNRAIIGAYGDDFATGSAYYFEYDGIDWNQIQKLTPGDGTPGDYFGVSIGLDGNRVLIGAYLSGINNNVTGAAYIFEYSGSWSQAAKLTAGDGQPGDYYGANVSLDGDRAVVGAWAAPSSALVGATYVYDYDSADWNETKITASDARMSSTFGINVEVDGDRLLVGSSWLDDLGIQAGAAYVYELADANTPHDYLFLSDGLIDVNKSTRLEGDLHANGNLVLDPKNNTYITNLSAVGAITIGANLTIDGDATAGGAITIGSNANVRGSVTPNASVSPVALPTVAPFSHGTSNVIVANNTTQTLAPGSYKKVIVNNDATLEISSGDYFIERLIVKKRARVEADVTGGAIGIHIKNRLRMYRYAELETFSGGQSDEMLSDLVTVEVLRNQSVIFSADTRFLGTLIAPASTVIARGRVYVRGAICAATIDVGNNGAWLHHDAPAAALMRLAEATPQTLAEAALPSAFSLEQNYPNPFNPRTTIRFALTQAGPVRLAVYDMLGRRVALLADGVLASGAHEVAFVADALPSGAYLYRLETAHGTAVKQMFLVK